MFSIVFTTCFSHVQFSYANNENQNTQETSVVENETTEETKESIVEKENVGGVEDEISFDEEENVSTDEEENVDKTENESNVDTETETEEENQNDFSESTEETNDKIEESILETVDADSEKEEIKEESKTEENNETAEETNPDSTFDIASRSELTKDVKISTESFIDANNDEKKEVNYGYIPEIVTVPISKLKNTRGFLFGADDIPTKYDSREHTNPETGLSYISPVRDQNPFGTCWAFSTIAMFESSARVKGLAKTEEDANLSEAAVAYFTYGLDDVTNGGEYMDKPGLEGK